MKRIILCCWLTTCWMTAALAQGPDTLTYAVGKITSSTTNELVTARISYESLPYGSKVGTLSGSSFKFPLFDNDKYSITVEAAGYAPAKYLLDPAEANEERLVIKDIELGPPRSASEIANDTHTVGRVLLLKSLIFNQGKAKINEKSYSELDSVVTMLNQNPNMVIQLEGHTDTRGNPKQNLKLSETRVEAVKDYLVSKGVSKRAVKTKAFGGSMPVSREDTEEAHQLNRRVEVRILKN